MQHPNYIVFLSASEFNFPFPFAFVDTVSVGGWTLMRVCVCVFFGGGVHVHPCDYLCLLLSSWCFSFFLNKFIYFIYLFLAALGLRCCARAFSSGGKWGLLFVTVRGLLIAVASLVAQHGL